MKVALGNSSAILICCGPLSYFTSRQFVNKSSRSRFPERASCERLVVLIQSYPARVVKFHRVANLAARDAAVERHA